MIISILRLVTARNFTRIFKIILAHNIAFVISAEGCESEILMSARHKWANLPLRYTRMLMQLPNLAK